MHGWPRSSPIRFCRGVLHCVAKAGCGGLWEYWYGFIARDASRKCTLFYTALAQLMAHSHTDVTDRQTDNSVERHTVSTLAHSLTRHTERPSAVTLTCTPILYDKVDGTHNTVLAPAPLSAQSHVTRSHRMESHSQKCGGQHLSIQQGGRQSPSS